MRPLRGSLRLLVCCFTHVVMNTWRPPEHIRVKAIGLNWRAGRLLAAEVRDDEGRVTGVRPLGGSVEFGERAEVAVKREFREELGVEIEIISGPLVIENLFSHAGVDGHEVVFVYEIEFPATAFQDADHIVLHESDGTTGVARWYDLDRLDIDGYPDLYPKGLKGALTTVRVT